MGLGLLYDMSLPILVSSKWLCQSNVLHDSFSQQAVNNLLVQPHLPELTKYRLCKKEWEVLWDFEVILSVIQSLCMVYIPLNYMFLLGAKSGPA